MKDTKNIDWLLTQPGEYQVSLFQEYSEMMRMLANHLLNDETENVSGIYNLAGGKLELATDDIRLEARLWGQPIFGAIFTNDCLQLEGLSGCRK